MGQSGDKFLELRNEAVNNGLYFAGKTKKQIVQDAETLVADLIDGGDFDSANGLVKIVKLKDFMAVLEKVLRDDLADDMNKGEDLVKSGVRFVYSEGTKKVNYMKDPTYQQIKMKLYERAQLLKNANASKEVIFDPDGFEVSEVGYIYSKDSIKISY